jgi:heavy metal sensor kinase
MNLTIRARLTILYLLVLAGSFVAFFWICDIGFRRSIEATVNDASRTNLETVQRLLANTAVKGDGEVRGELTKLADLWANGAIFEVADAGGSWIFRSPRFLRVASPLPAVHERGMVFLTTNLDSLQYRIVLQRLEAGGQVFEVHAAVPTEPFDRALDHFRLIEKETLPLLVLLASLLGYWLSGRSLAPVNRIIETAELIGVQNLSRRLEVPKARDELRRLTETLNAMLARIESSVQRITQFTADASHDLRTPVALIRTSAELALRRTRSANEYRDALSRILATSERTTELIENLLTLARTDALAGKLQFERTDIVARLDRAAEQGRVLATLKGIQVSKDVSRDSAWMLADANAIERLFLILIENAVKYTPDGGRINIHCDGQSGAALIEIRDSGIGIAEKDLPHIFERFYRADQARSREPGGAGLGLSIARSIVDIHRGTIQAESTPGGGSTFRIALPLA